jgi:3-phosphoshikimate 1-carboxyvinyltransferase
MRDIPASSAAAPPLLALPYRGATVRGEVRLPGSKSITNRALIIAALADGESRLQGALRADDTELMIEALRVLLGCEISWEGSTIRLRGVGGNFPAGNRRLYVGDAGTAARFLLPLCSLVQGESLVEASPRMGERPIGDLLDALAALGVEVGRAEEGRSFPLRLWGQGSVRGGEVQMSAAMSSQFVSGVLLSAPYFREDICMYLSSAVVSPSYIAMTQGVMAAFGVSSSWEAGAVRCAAGQRYIAREYRVEGDASSASYFFAMAAISGGELLVRGVSRSSLQGDMGFVAILEDMGCWLKDEADGLRIGRNGALRAVDVDMNSMSDVALTLAVVALFAEGTTRIEGVGHMRWKECDRIAALVEELTKVGARASAGEDWIAIEGGYGLQGARLGTHGDHRMAMALALLSLRVEGIVIENSGCVGKTYPGFFAEFLQLLH